MMFESTGNIRAQIGASLNSIRAAVHEQDIGRVADQTSLLVAITSPKLQNPGKYKVPVGDGTDESDRLVFQACLGIIQGVLEELSRSQLYAFSDIEGTEEDIALKEVKIPDE